MELAPLRQIVGGEEVALVKMEMYQVMQKTSEKSIS
jgi:hypothetical protein